MRFEVIRFVCNGCKHETDIFFEFKFNWSEVLDLGECKGCKKVLHLCVGDLGYRTDIPNPDYPPWQAQFIRVKTGFSFCTLCQENQKQDTKIGDLEANCPICKKTTMQAIHSSNSKNKGLETLLNDISK